MPQAPTANMGLIKPAELGDSGVWASLLDAMFDLIDAHDHSAGKGLKVSMLNGVNVAADIPWNSAGTFYAITGLKAIDFQPQPQSAMTGFAGALFVDSANNELSYRTTGGSIIRFTNGATFNFAAIGAIGGDYSAVGALVDFVDANDLYRFRQQVGGGVQQYARLDCGGVDLFEFKANPAAGVPANRVRVSSPAALAASYEVFWPTAMPASAKTIMQIDSTGQMSAGTIALPSTLAYVMINPAGTLIYQQGPFQYHASAAQPNGIGVPTYDGTQWFLGVGTTLSCPIILPVGSPFSAWQINISKLSSGAGTVSVSLRDINMLTHAVATVGPVQSSSANAPGDIQLTGAGTIIAANHSYWLNFSCAGASGDILYGWAIQP